MSEPIPVIFTYRVIGIDGTVVIANLEHKHSSRWTIKFMQAGMVGSSVIGDFEIPLHDPGSNETMLTQDDYDKLTSQMRIEGYLGDEIAGDPLVTGIIRETPTKMNEFTIKGADIIILAQTALTGRNDRFIGTTDKLLTRSLSAYKLAFRDKFTGVAPFDLSQYSTTGGWDLTTDPDGKPAIVNDSSYTSDGLLLSTVSLTREQYEDLYADAWFVLKSDTTAGSHAEAGVVLAAADTSNLILGRGYMERITATRYEIAAEIWQKAGGSWGTVKKRVGKVINGPSETQRIKVTFTAEIPEGASSGSYAEVVAADSPISWWHCDDASPNDLTDAMPVANNLTVHDSVTNDLGWHQTAGTIGGTWSVKNHYDGQSAFWGAGVDGGVINDASSLGQGPNATYSFYDNFTMEVWIYPTSLTVYGVENSYMHGGLIMMNGGNHDTRCWGMFLGNSGDATGGRYHRLWLFWKWHNNPSDNSIPVADWNAYETGYEFPSANAWYHVVITRVSGTWHFYVNGAEVGTPVNITPVHDEIEGFSIGGRADANAYNFDGRIDEVAIYNVPLTSDQVLAHYLAGAVGPKAKFTVLLNGFDSGCNWTAPVSLSGKVGLRSANNNGGKAYAANFVVPSKVAIFNPGSVSPGTRSLDQSFGNTPYLDRWNIAATTEGVAWRLVRHPFIDSVDYGPAVGNDKTSIVHFREGYDLHAASSIEPNVDPPTTAVRVSSGAAQDNSGFVEWIDIDAADALGLVYGNMSAQNVSDTLGQQVLAQTFSHLQGNPGSAKKFKVTRFIETADKFTVGDFVKATSARLNLSNETIQIMEITYNEGLADLDIVGDQYPKGDDVAMMRTTRQLLDQLATGTAALTPTSSSGIVYDSRYGSPFILPCWSGYEFVDSTHKLRLRFEIPANLAVLQKTVLSFTQLPFRGGHQTTSGASSASTTASGGSSTPTSDASGDFAARWHIAADAGENNNPLHWNSTRGQVESGDTTTGDQAVIETSTEHHHVVTIAGHTHGMTHTHNINDPSAIFEVGMARNTHLYIDGSGDLSSAVGGPWDGGGSEYDVSEVDITPYIQSGGFHEIQLSSTALGGMKACVYVFGLLKSI